MRMLKKSTRTTFDHTFVIEQFGEQISFDVVFRNTGQNAIMAMFTKEQEADVDPKQATYNVAAKLIDTIDNTPVKPSDLAELDDAYPDFVTNLFNQYHEARGTTVVKN